MPVTTILIGGDIPDALVDDMARRALASGYGQDGEGRAVLDHAAHFRECASAGRPVALTRIDPVFVRNRPPPMPLHAFLADASVRFKAVRHPSEGVDGRVEVWTPRTGAAAMAADIRGEPLLDLAGIGDRRRATGASGEGADGELLRHLVKRMQAIRENPGPAVLVGPAPRPG